jgi:hypothetical protein
MGCRCCCRRRSATAAAAAAAAAVTPVVLRPPAPATQALFVLFESASGFALFDIKGVDEIGQSTDKVQASVRCVFWPCWGARAARQRAKQQGSCVWLGVLEDEDAHQAAWHTLPAQRPAAGVLGGATAGRPLRA